MVANRLMAIILAVALTVSYIPSSWAEDASPAQDNVDGGSIAAAAVSDIIYIPGKTTTCALSGALWTVAMMFTLGNCYKQCGNFVHDHCTGKWVIKGEDMASNNESSQTSKPRNILLED